MLPWSCKLFGGAQPAGWRCGAHRQPPHSSGMHAAGWPDGSCRGAEQPLSVSNLLSACICSASSVS